MQRARPYSPQLQRSHPLADRIGFFAVPGLGSQTDLVSGALGILFAGSLNGPTPVGEGFRSTSDTAHGFYWPFPQALDPDGDGYVADYTIAVFAQWVSWPAFGKILCFPYRQDTSWSSPFTSLALQTDGSASSTARIDSTDWIDAGNNSSNVANYMVANVPAAYVVTRSGTSASFWRDGRLIGTATFGSGNPVTFRGSGISVRPNLYLCQRNHQNTGEGCQATVLAAGLWPRVLSADEIRLWSADPFGLARPKHRIRTLYAGVPAPPPSSGGARLVGPSALVGRSALVDKSPLVTPRRVG